jgi:C-terminal processing protease CtpA/Prc
MDVLKTIAILGLLTLPACHQSKSQADVCSPGQTKSDVYAATLQHYLWNTELPSIASPDTFASATDLLQALTAPTRLEGKDRNFTYLTTKQALQSYFQEGTAVGFGSQFLQVGEKVFIADVLPGTPAALGGWGRGDEILATAATAAGLDDPGNQMASLLASGAIHDAIATSGTKAVRFFRLKKALTGAIVDLSAISSPYGLDPVPGANAPIILDAGGGHRVGYLLLRTFIQPASDLLRQTLGAFRDKGVTDLIVDFRYNGGGSVGVAVTLANLLNRGHVGEVMTKVLHNPTHSQFDQTVNFAVEPNAMAPGRIAFITSGRSASASEAVVNVPQPYYGKNLAMVGKTTYGKPVGQTGFDSASCDWVLMLVNMEFVNALGNGRYFQGLPDANFSGVSMQVEDDLTRALGDPDEACVAAALQWIATGSTGTLPPMSTAGVQVSAPAATHPLPNLAQQYQPGLF